METGYRTCPWSYGPGYVYIRESSLLLMMIFLLVLKLNLGSGKDQTGELDGN